LFIRTLKDTMKMKNYKEIMKTLNKIFLIAGFIVGLMLPGIKGIAQTIPVDTTKVNRNEVGPGETVSNQNQVQNRNRNQTQVQNQQGGTAVPNAGNQNGEQGKVVKQVKGARPDMSKMKGARPNIQRPAGSGIPRGAGKPGGAGRMRGR
jgi:hypothetical protein